MNVTVRYTALATAAAQCALAGSATGGVIEFEDKELWIDAVGEFSTVDFTGFPSGTPITDQYEPLGIVFSDGDDFVLSSSTSFPNDGRGLFGFASVSLDFMMPQHAIGIDAGQWQIDAFSAGEPVFTITIGANRVDTFGGLISSEPFDTVVITAPFPGDEVAFDDLHFGVPAPGALWLLALGAVAGAKRRGRCP